MSRRLGEQGKALLNVVVGADGAPKQVSIKQSSGYARLDDAAKEATMRCRFLPGKVNGVPQTMTYEAPFNFELK